MKNFLFLILPAVIGILSGCSKTESVPVPAMSAGAVLIDVRSEEEFSSGHHAGAVNIPHTQIKEKISASVPDKNTPLYLYCRSGRRVGIAMTALKELGYQTMFNLGGFEEAKKFIEDTKK